MSIRLALTAQHPKARWLTARMLGHGLGCERAALQFPDSRTAMLFFPSQKLRLTTLLPNVEKACSEYDSVLLYCRSSNTPRLTKLLSSFPNLQIKPIP